MSMNLTKIEWCDFTWNPVTGCLHNCEYCYARKMSARWNRIECDRCNGCGTAWLSNPPDFHINCIKCNGYGTVPHPDHFKPKFHPDRLDQPAKCKKPARIFVGSVCDLFGEFIPDEWIEKVFAACEAAKQHTFYFLTKDTARYGHGETVERFQNNKNWWAGFSASDEYTYYMRRRQVKVWPRTFLSLEPLHGEINLSRPLDYSGPDLDPLGWLIVGSETRNGRPVNMPKREWLLDIREQCKALGIPLFEKNSLAGLLPEGLIQQWPEEA